MQKSENMDKKDLSQNCDFDDDSDKNDCWHCIHFLFPLGCMYGEDTNSSRKFKKREKPLYSLSEIAEMNEAKYKTKENDEGERGMGELR